MKKCLFLLTIFCLAQNFPSVIHAMGNPDSSKETQAMQSLIGELNLIRVEIEQKKLDLTQEAFLLKIDELWERTDAFLGSTPGKKIEPLAEALEFFVETLAGQLGQNRIVALWGSLAGHAFYKAGNSEKADEMREHERETL